MLPEPSRLLGPSTSRYKLPLSSLHVSSSASNSYSISHQKSLSNLSAAKQRNTKKKMNSSLALKRLLSPNILTRSLRSLPVAATARRGRFFNTNAAPDFDDEDGGRYGRELDFDRRSARYASRRRDDFFTDSLFPFLAPTSLSQVLNLMDQMADHPYLSAMRRGWDAKETDDALYLRVDMPGLGKEDVKVCVEQNTLIIKGEGVKEEGEEEEVVNRYSERIELPEKVFKTEEIKAEMKNGVLKVVVPKVKEEERSDVFHVKVE